MPQPKRHTVTEREPYPGQQWKCGDEFLPFHPQASHVPPDYRDGWNRCYWMASARFSAPLQDEPKCNKGTPAVEGLGTGSGDRGREPNPAGVALPDGGQQP